MAVAKEDLPHSDSKAFRVLSAMRLDPSTKRGWSRTRLPRHCIPGVWRNYFLFLSVSTKLGLLTSSGHLKTKLYTTFGPNPSLRDLESDSRQSPRSPYLSLGYRLSPTMEASKFSSYFATDSLPSWFPLHHFNPPLYNYSTGMKLVNLREPSLWAFVGMVCFNPVFWNSVAQNGMFHHEPSPTAPPRCCPRTQTLPLPLPVSIPPVPPPPTPIQAQRRSHSNYQPAWTLYWNETNQVHRISEQDPHPRPRISQNRVLRSSSDHLLPQLIPG